MTKYYSLRADESEHFNNADDMLEVLQVKAPYMWCRETTREGNVHYHFYFESDLKKPTLRARVTSLTGRGNGCYSLKECDERMPVKYLAYIMKDLNYHMEGIPDEVYRDAVNYDDKVKADKKQKKEKKNVLKEIEDGYLAQYNDPRVIERDNELGRSPFEHPRMLLEYIVKFYLEKGILRQHTVQAVFDTIRLRHSESFKQVFYDYMLERYSPRGYSIG